MRRSRPHSGTRPDLGLTRFRSGWECNWARYLNLLIDRGEVDHWEYEPQTFTFPVRRGNKTYTPDFLVAYVDGTYAYHEVKGWMDNDSRIKLKRFAIHYPKESLVLIDKTKYKEIELLERDNIPEWE